ncbi:MAG TPA: hypothetical protein VLM17_02710 [Xanthomonadaceae bacterium]|nr:hypothetical protein [Xanthomonadaceae bacterium]
MTTPKERARRSGESVGQRLLALVVFIVLGVLLWLAYSGRYDHGIGRIAAWLRAHYDLLAEALR